MFSFADLPWDHPYFVHLVAAGTILVAATLVEGFLEIRFPKDPRHGAHHLRSIASAIATHLISLASVQLGSDIFGIMAALTAIACAGVMLAIWLAAGFLMPTDLPFGGCLASWVSIDFFASIKADYGRLKRVRLEDSGDEQIAQEQIEKAWQRALAGLASRVGSAAFRPAVTYAIYRGRTYLMANHAQAYTMSTYVGLLIGICVALFVIAHVPKNIRNLRGLKSDDYLLSVEAQNVYEHLQLPWARVLVVFSAQLMLCAYLTVGVISSPDLGVSGFPQYFYAGAMMAILFGSQTGISFETHVPKEAETWGKLARMSEWRFAHKAEATTKLRAAFAVTYLGQEDRVKYDTERNEVIRKGLRSDEFELGSYELLTRMLLATLANFGVQTYLITVVPFLLASSDSMQSFVKDALALSFVVNLDNLVHPEKVETAKAWKAEWDRSLSNAKVELGRQASASTAWREASQSMAFFVEPHRLPPPHQEAPRHARGIDMGIDIRHRPDKGIAGFFADKYRSGQERS